MFCACVGILICVAIIIVGSVVSAIDIDVYDFGLYYVLLAIVAMCVSFTVCVIRPVKCCGVRDPKWYTRVCENVHQALVDAHDRRLAHLESTIGEPTADGISAEDSSRKKSTAAVTRQRATLMMLGPAVQMMHHVIHGVAENTSAADDEEDEEENGFTSLWWDMAGAESIEEGKMPKKKKKKKKKRRRDKEAELCTIVSLKADVAVLAHPVATEDVSTIDPRQASNADAADSENKTSTRAQADSNVVATETYL